MTHRRSWWWGRAAGVVAGVAIAGGAGAGTNYIHNPLLGVAVAGAGAVVGFAAGLGWDRRQDRLERERGWDAVFTDGPGPGPGGQGSPDSAWYWLSPWLAVVPFETRRRRYVAPVRRWCLKPQPGRVWLISGGPGSGKTRLAMQIAQTLRRVEPSGWAVGWVRPGQGAAAIEVAVGWDRPVLIVVDDADVREDLDELLTALHRTSAAHLVRMLLVARDFSDWWTLVQQPLPMPVERADGHAVLGTVVDGVPGQRVAAKQAAAVFAEKLGAGAVEIELTGIAAGTPLILLHAAALESVWRAREGRDGPVAVADAVAALLVREQQVWQRHAVEQGLDAYPQITVRTLRDVLVFMMLIGARSIHDTHTLLPLLPDLQDATAELIDRLAVWLHLYGRVIGFWARPHLPAVFAEHLACDALTDNPELATALVLAADTPEQAITVLTLLARAATHAPAALPAITTLIAADPHRLLPLAIGIALTGHGRVDSAIAAAVEHADPGWDNAQTLHQLLPDSRYVLNHTQVVVAHARATHAPTNADRADALTTLAEALFRAGRFGEGSLPPMTASPAGGNWSTRSPPSTRATSPTR